MTDTRTHNERSRVPVLDHGETRQRRIGRLTRKLFQPFVQADAASDNDLALTQHA